MTMKSKPIQKYMEEILKQAQQNPPKPGEVTDITVMHDDWCNLIRGKGPCNCNPIVKRIKPKRERRA